MGTRLAVRFAVKAPLKFIPIVGQTANAAMAFAYTYSLGKACCWYFGEMKLGHIPRPEELDKVWADQLQQAVASLNATGQAEVKSHLSGLCTQSPGSDRTWHRQRLIEQRDLCCQARLPGGRLIGVLCSQIGLGIGDARLLNARLSGSGWMLLGKHERGNDSAHQGDHDHPKTTPR